MAGGGGGRSPFPSNCNLLIVNPKGENRVEKITMNKDHGDEFCIFMCGK